MMKQKVFGVLLVTLLCVQYCSGLMCYFCQDTSSDEGKNKCQTWVRTMRHYRRKYNEEGTFLTEKFVKNCTNYNGEDGPTYCMIARIESRGSVRSFIRDCSDGINFFDDDWNSRFQNRVAGDNQTTCIYTGTSDLACVTICNDEHFCNGPLNTATHYDVTIMRSLLTVVLFFMMKMIVV